MESRIDYIRPALASLLIGFMLASFSQSCSLTKASISNYLVPVRVHTDNLRVEPHIKPFEPLFKSNGVLDTSRRFSHIQEMIKIVDTTDYHRLILGNQQLSLLNEKKILELLVNKERENKKLKSVNTVLTRKNVVSVAEKQDAISMTVLWETGKMLLTVGCVIILLLIVQTGIMIWIFKRKKASLNN